MMGRYDVMDGRLVSIDVFIYNIMSHTQSLYEQVHVLTRRCVGVTVWRTHGHVLSSLCLLWETTVLSVSVSCGPINLQ